MAEAVPLGPRPVLVCGSCNVDLIATMPRFPATGETIFGTDFLKCLGGKGGNQCVMAARLAATTGSVTMIGALGTDSFGDEYAQALKSDGVTPLLARCSGVPTGIASIFVRSTDGANQIVTISGANAKICPEQLSEPEAAAAIAKSWAVLCQLEVNTASTLAALRAAQAAGALSILTPAPVPASGLSAELYIATDIMIPNRTEVLALAGMAAAVGGDDAAVSMATLLEAAERVLARGCGALVVTCGSQGSLVVARRGAAAPGADAAEDAREACGRAVFIPAVKARAVVDTTGAGDAFCGSLGFFLAQLMPHRRATGGAVVDASVLIEACRRAAVVAADSVSKAGTQSSFARRSELPAFLFEGCAAAATAAGLPGDVDSGWSPRLPEPVPAAEVESV